MSSRVVRLLGTALVVASLGALAWTYLGSDVISKHHQGEARDAIVAALDAPAPAPATIDGGHGKKVKGIGLLSIQTLGIKSAPIAEGLDDRVIDRGLVGHAGAMPGEGGNVTLAAHVVTHGEVFKRLGDLRRGDRITISTADGTFRYVVTQPPLKVKKADTRAIGLVSSEQVSLVTCASRWTQTDERLWVVAKPIKEKR